MNRELIVPVDARTLDWPRRVANAINWLLGNHGARIEALEAKVVELESRIEALEP